MSTTEPQDLSYAMMLDHQETQLVYHKPRIDSLEDLHCLGVAFSNREGKTVVEYKFICFLDEMDRAYFYKTLVPKRDLTPSIIQQCLEPILDEETYPEPPAGLPIFSSSINEDFYLKRPDLKSWDDFEGHSFLAELLLGEVDVFEALAKHPHPNIVRYHGCRVARGRITAIVLDNYPITLERRWETKADSDMDRNTIFEGIKAAITHLHSLGRAHNYLNPYNVMLDQDDQAVLIDMGSCKPFGGRLMELSTHGWNEAFSPISKAEHDNAALKRLRNWLELSNVEQQLDEDPSKI